MSRAPRLRRLRLPHAGRRRGRPRARSARARGAADDACRRRASRTTASATTSRTGSRRGPSSRWRIGCGRARCRTSRRSSTCGASWSARFASTAARRAAASSSISTARTFDPERRRSTASAAGRSAARRAAWRSCDCPARASPGSPSGSRACASACRRPWCWGRTSSTSSSTQDDLARFRAGQRRTRPRSTRRFVAAELPGRRARGPRASLVDARPLPAGGPLVEPARGLAVSAVRRHLRHVHALERHASADVRLRSCSTGDQARLCLDVQARGQAVSRGRPVSPRRGEDGGRPPAGRRRRARHGASTRTSPASRARTTTIRCAPMQSEDGIAAVALGLGETVVGGRPCFRFCPALSATHRPVLLGPGHPRQRAARVLRAGAGPGQRYGRIRAGALRPGRGGEATARSRASARPIRRRTTSCTTESRGRACGS